MTVTVQISFCDIQSTVIIMSWQLVYNCYCPFVPLQCQNYNHLDVMTAGVTVTVHLFLYNVKSTVTMMLWQLVWLLLSICSFTMSNLRSSWCYDSWYVCWLAICSFTMSNLRSSWCHDSWYDCYCPFVPLQCPIYGHHDVMTAGMTVTVHLLLYNVRSTFIMILWQLVCLILVICSFIMPNLW